MQNIYIEENLQHSQIVQLCQFIDSNICSSLEFRRCKINDDDFDLLMKSLSKNPTPIYSLIFNIQMIDETKRFRKFLRMLMHCSNLVNLQVHGNNIDDGMFALLHSTLHEYCPKLSLLDIGDNNLTNKSIVQLCTLIVGDEKRKGLEELTMSGNLSISNAGWTELFFAISFKNRLKRLALDYNRIDDSLAAMLSMIIASNPTLISIDLEACQLSEYAGQLFLGLITKYPVSLEEIYLDQNPDILDSTKTSIKECLNLKSRRNSLSSENQVSFRLPLSTLPEDDSSTISEDIRPVKKEKKKNPVDPRKETMTKQTRVPSKPVGFERKNVAEREKKIEQNSDEIEELEPVEIQPYGMIRALPHWQRIY